MAYIPIKDSYKRLEKYFEAAGVPIPPRCKTITVVWDAGSAAQVEFIVWPEEVPDMPIPIEGAQVTTKFADVGVKSSPP